MKTVLLIVTFFSLSLFADSDIPKPTENSGMNKYERINKIEKDLIKLAKKVQRLEKQLMYKRSNDKQNKKKDSEK